MLGKANSTDLNQLGIAYYNHRNFAKALEFYRRSAAIESDAAPLFNMGLVFNDPEVSQDLDAADAYRRALALKPDYERAKERLETYQAESSFHSPSQRTLPRRRGWFNQTTCFSSTSAHSKFSRLTQLSRSRNWT